MPAAHIQALITRLDMPVVTTCHTVLSRPTPAQYNVLRKIAELSSIVVVMAEKARELLHTVYDIAAEKIEVIPHGIPDFPFVEPDLAKVKLGFTAKPVILTFGLLSPNKGIEVVIDAMPLILKSRPDAVYVVLGATHPNLVRQEGEAYRESLMARARELGVQDNVVFLDQFVDQPTAAGFHIHVRRRLCDAVLERSANDVGATLAYSFGLGKAVVSTPYWHARELLADGRGVLVPFHDSVAIGTEVSGLLTDEPRRHAMRVRAYSESRSMTWKRIGERYHAVFTRARRNHRLTVIANLDKRAPAKSTPPDMQIGHLLSMCDDTGLFQHAIHSIPDRSPARAIASTTMPARFCWPAPSTRPANRPCRTY